jgi:hypothetical protein
MHPRQLHRLAFKMCGAASAALNLRGRCIDERWLPLITHGRRKAAEAKGTAAWKVATRYRKISQALQAYAAMTASASLGAVRDVTRIQRYPVSVTGRRSSVK